MDPTEVVILYGEVLLTCTSLFLLVYDLSFGTVMIEGRMARYMYFMPGRNSFSLLLVHLGALHYKPQHG
jgi:hypothetical protein